MWNVRLSPCFTRSKWLITWHAIGPSHPLTKPVILWAVNVKVPPNCRKHHFATRQICKSLQIWYQLKHIVLSFLHTIPTPTKPHCFNHPSCFYHTKQHCIKPTKQHYVKHFVHIFPTPTRPHCVNFCSPLPTPNKPHCVNLSSHLSAPLKEC